MGFTAVAFSFDLALSALGVWLASQVKFVNIHWRDIIIIVFSVSLIAVIPGVGLLLSVILFLYLLVRFSACSVVNAATLVAVVKFFWLVSVAIFGASYLN